MEKILEKNIMILFNKRIFAHFEKRNKNIPSDILFAIGRRIKQCLQSTYNKQVKAFKISLCVLRKIKITKKIQENEILFENNKKYTPLLVFPSLKVLFNNIISLFIPK